MEPRPPGADPQRSSGGPSVPAYIGLGANLGDPPALLSAAIVSLGAFPGTRLVGVSRLYRTRPVGLLEQPDFHNAAVHLEVPRGPDPEAGALALLIALKSLERSMGRRVRERWGPRELDLDLLVFGQHRILVERPGMARRHDPGRTGVQWLEVPHPAARERLFVLAPLAELAPELVPPGWAEPVAEAARRALAAEGPDAVTVVASWGGAERGWREPAEQGGREGMAGS